MNDNVKDALNILDELGGRMAAENCEHLAELLDANLVQWDGIDHLGRRMIRRTTPANTRELRVNMGQIAAVNPKIIHVGGVGPSAEEVAEIMRNKLRALGISSNFFKDPTNWATHIGIDYGNINPHFTVTPTPGDPTAWNWQFNSPKPDTVHFRDINVTLRMGQHVDKVHIPIGTRVHSHTRPYLSGTLLGMRSDSIGRYCGTVTLQHADSETVELPLREFLATKYTDAWSARSRMVTDMVCQPRLRTLVKIEINP